MMETIMGLLQEFSNIVKQYPEATAILIVGVILTAAVKQLPQHLMKRKIKRLSDNQWSMTPDEFFTIRKTKDKTHIRFPGIYILHNQTNNKYYVGQAKDVFQRANKHFTGSGNGDVYADFKLGHKWNIQIIELYKSPYATLNELERHTILAYNAFERGYNRTRGNKN